MVRKRRATLTKRVLRWVDRNSNLVASLLAFTAILVTIYYSSINFSLANRQYKDLLAQRESDSVRNSKEQERNNKIHIQDSITIAKSDSDQRIRWQQQYEINKQQLATFKQQTEVSKLQFENQRAAYLAQQELDRPNLVFSAINISIDTVLKKQAVARLFIANSSRTNTVVKRIVVFAWDVISGIYTFKGFPDDIEANSLSVVSIDLPQSLNFLVNPNTFYYIRIYHTGINKEVIAKDIFSRVDMRSFPNIMLGTIPVEMQAAFKKMLADNLKNYDQFLDEPDKGIVPQLK